MMTLVKCLAIAALGAIGALVWGAPDALACGRTTPCSCGDSVTFSRTLTRDDPVTRTVCTGPVALRVLTQAALNLGQQTIRCAGAAGIVIAGDSATVTNGTVQGCAVGVATEGPHDAVRVVKVRALHNALGMEIADKGNVLSSNLVSDNEGDGIVVEGNDNTIVDNHCVKNEGSGMTVEGEGNFIIKNYCAGNGQDGVVVSGVFNTLHENQGVNNGGRGVFAGLFDSGGGPGEWNYGSGNRTAPNCQVDGKTTAKEYC